VKRIRCYLPLLCLTLLALPVIHAQSSVDVNVGGGYFHSKSLGSVDPNTFLLCSGSAAAGCVKTPALGSVFLGFGANLMLWKKFGVGGEAVLQPGRQDYVTFSQGGAGQFSDVLQSRATFYDFNGIFEPVSTKKVSVQLIGGIGGANVKFYEHVTGSSSILGNTNVTQFAGSSNHFQLHAGLGIQAYVTEHVFIRPQFDLHYVHNFTQYGENAVPGVMIWIGYTLGDRQ
jgi:hypothetical protein